MSKIKILIIENDQGNCLRKKLEKSEFEITGNYDNSSDAIQSFIDNEPDLLVIDVELKNGPLDGIGLALELNNIQPKPIIYLASKPNSFNISRTIQTNPCYLFLKDSTPQQLKVAIDFAISSFSAKNNASTKNNTQIHTKNPGYVLLYNNFFFVKHHTKYIRVNIDDILWVKADAGCVEIVTNKTKIVTYANLSSFTRQITHPNLIRVHRSYVINVHKVTAFNEGKLSIPYCSNVQRIPIGKTYQDLLQQYFPMLRSD